MATETRMGAKDRTYNLVSVLYHTLRESSTLETYITDAREAGDDELSGFLQEIQSQDRDRAQKAKRLLTGRLSQS
ncbi:hypothetical protein GCM10018793_58080 [Streptomyces sulfonofaciens]|uniref:Uncharacterized protein n=1 Tax=Streptomyces sulfonofaciens TaxID=68272 RepID=A0A919GLR3_9ACTN|nr:hypothetical protein [Streptomyces sulfonofaciens]GHH86388.1 hypothetical protein GCM10018793_58080 [Streptomyces sulfonofaciens]